MNSHEAELTSRRTVLVTGSSSGIGQATVLALAAAGWEVFAGVRDLRAAPLHPGSRTRTGLVRPIRLDVTDPASITAATARLTEALHTRRLDAVVNNAGVGRLAPMQTIPIEDLRAVFDVNVFGTVALTQSVLPLMGVGSRLVFIGSVGDRITMPFGGPLTSSKWAIASIAEAFRLELVASGIPVVLVEPGSIHTPAVDKVEQAAHVTAARLTASRPELARRFETAATRAVVNERAGSAPDVAADAVVHALIARRPHTRYLTGRHARLLALLGRLPDAVFDHLRLRLFGQPTRPSAATGTSALVVQGTP